MICVFISCNKYTSPSPTHWQLIAGRDNGDSPERPLLYRALVPLQWIRADPPATESIADTMKPLCTFYIRENHQFIRIIIHTFPLVQGHPRITPQMQVTRWKQQFQELDLAATQVQQDSHGGFSGLFLETEGIFEGVPLKIMGWTMQLASPYERQLALGRMPLDSNKRADYTIKASGPPHLMNSHRAAIAAFACSFEFIDELPAP